MKLIFSMLIYFIIYINLFAHDRAWVDLPEIKVIPPFLISEEDNTKLKMSIEFYHQLNKNEEGLLPQRIEILSNIAKFIESRKGSLKNSLADKYHTLTVKKLWYLQELHKIYISNLDSFENLATRHTQGFSEFSNNNYLQPLVLANKVMFDPKLPGHWGLFWMETIDPCHRQLMPYYTQWERIKGKKSHFFMWLETQNVPFYIPFLHFLSDQELSDKRVNITFGKLVSNTGKVLQMDQKDQEYIFIIDMQKNIFVSEANNFIHHVSLSRGNPLLASGAIKIKDGIIKFMNMESGHYLPCKFFAKQTLDLLQEFGVDIMNNASLEFYENDELKKTTFKEFLLKYKNWKTKPTKNYLPRNSFEQFSTLRGKK